MIRCPNSLKKCWLVVVASRLARRSRHGHAVAFVEEDQVQIAVVIELAAAELAHGQRDQFAGAQIAVDLDHRFAQLGGQLGELFLRDPFQARLGDVGSAPLIASIRSLPRMSRTPTRRVLGVLEAVQDRVDILGARGKARSAWRRETPDRASG